MRRSSGIVLGLLAWAALLLTGCASRLNDNRTVTIEPQSTHEVIYSAPKQDQKVTIEVSSQGVPVNAYLVLEKEKGAAKSALDANRAPEKPLAMKEKFQTGTLEATVPAGAEFVLLLTADSGKGAQVNVKATGR
jgi:hypothetical protein